MEDKPYAAAVVHMPDREPQEVTKAMVYPITRVDLFEMRDGNVVKARSFAVNEHQQWVEVTGAHVV